jgi:hypothetical protein
MGWTKYIANTLRPKPLMCSDCFDDEGLRLEAERIGKMNNGQCPKCNSPAGFSLDRSALEELQAQFFSRSTAMQQYQVPVAVLGTSDDDSIPDDDIQMRPETQHDWLLIKDAIGGRLFRRSPRLFYFGVTNHFGENNSLDKKLVRDEVIPKLRRTVLASSTPVYRIRLNLDEERKFDELQYDAPPDTRRRSFSRFDNPKLPLLYSSPNLQVCIHECRVTLADDIFVATIFPTQDLSLIDLTGNFDQPENVDPFEDLEWFFRGLMNSSRPDVYRYCRRIAQTIKDETGADGFVYDSYFTNVAGDTGGKAINYALFGHPIADGKVIIDSINTVKLERIKYDFHLGPLFV